MALVLLPATAERAEGAGGFPKKSEIILEGMKLSEWPASEKVVYDESSGVLTFNNYQPNDYDYTNAMTVTGGSQLTIELKGASHIRSSRCSINAPGCDLIFTGSGSINLDANAAKDSDNPVTIYGILARNVTLKGGAYVSTSGNSGAGGKTANCIGLKASGNVSIEEYAWYNFRSYCSWDHTSAKPDAGIRADGAISITSFNESQCNFNNYGGHSEVRYGLYASSIMIKYCRKFSTIRCNMTNIPGFIPEGYYQGEEPDEGETRLFFKPAERQFLSIAGANRCQTAVEIAKSVFSSGPAGGEVIIVNGWKFPDALSASTYAGVAEAPILLSKIDSLHKDTKAFLKNEWAGKVSKVTVIGGEFKDGFYNDLSALGFSAKKGNLKKIAGKNRYVTAEEVLKETMALASSKGIDITAVAVTTGENPYDALSFSPWAYGLHIPILLVKGGKPRTGKTADLIKNAGYVFLLGDEKVCSEACLSEEQRTYHTYQRLAGKNRYKTSQEIAKFFVEITGGGTYDGAGFADGTEAHYVDALAACSLQGALNAPVILMEEAAKGDTHVKPWVIDNLAGWDSRGKTFCFIGWAAEGKSKEFDKLEAWITSKD